VQRSISSYVLALALTGLAFSCATYLLGFDLPVSVFVVSLLAVMVGGLASSLRREGGAKTEDIVTMVVAVIFSLWLLSRLSS
jgi:hypothetical protein